MSEEKDIPSEMLAQLEALATQRVEIRLREIVEQTLKQANITESGRRNELGNSLSINVHFLARKLDDGVRVEISAPKAIPEATARDLAPSDLEAYKKDLEQIRRQALQ